MPVRGSVHPCVGAKARKKEREHCGNDAELAAVRREGAAIDESGEVYPHKRRRYLRKQREAHS